MDLQTRKCRDCGGVDFVEDRSQGDLTCTGCGLVAESHMIDETAEWRSFADSDKQGVDMNRVGGAINPLLSDGLTTGIGEATKGDVTNSGLQALKRTHARGADPDRALHQAAAVISRLSDALRLQRNIRDRASELFKQIAPINLTRGRGMEAVCCAVLYTACRLERTPRTFKEILAVAQQASQKDVGRSYRAIEKFLQEQANEKGATVNGQGVGVLHVTDLLRRYCSALGLGHTDMRHATAIADAACPRDAGPSRPVRPWDGRSPLSIAAAIIYMLTRFPKTLVHPTIEDISRTVGISDSTIRLVYSELREFAADFVPSSLATADEVRRLP